MGPVWDRIADLAKARSQGIGKLTALAASKITKLGLTPDDDGLYLSVKPSKKGGLSKSWLVRFKGAGGRWREAGLGKFPDVSLAAARERTAALRAAAAVGQDPLVEREVSRAQLETDEKAARTAPEKHVSYPRKLVTA